MCAVPTYPFAVDLSDCTLNMALPNDGVWKRNVLGETATSDGKKIQTHIEVKYRWNSDQRKSKETQKI